MVSTRPTKRSRTTEKISLSIDRDDLVVLRNRAKHLYSGRLSAVIAEAIRLIREEEERDAVVA